jgi:ubiquinone/menaquinone biosynthesis C-methylase UbiE
LKVYGKLARSKRSFGGIKKENVLDDRRDLSQQRFGTFAQNYVSSAAHSTGYTLERLVALSEAAPGKRALDIATGGGHVALGMARRGAAVIASDLTPSMLRAARSFIAEQGAAAAPARFAQVDAQQLPVADNALDIVTCRLAAHHFPNAAAFVRECARVVKPGGIVGLVDQIGPADPKAARYLNAWEHLRDPSHGWQYSQGEWESFFVGEGLRLRASEEVVLRFDFAWWTQMQHNDADTVLRLRVMLKQAPETVAAWAEPDMPEGGAITFSHHHLILVGVKS